MPRSDLRGEATHASQAARPSVTCAALSEVQKTRSDQCPHPGSLIEDTAAKAGLRCTVMFMTPGSPGTPNASYQCPEHKLERRRL